MSSPAKGKAAPAAEKKAAPAAAGGNLSATPSKTKPAMQQKPDSGKPPKKSVVLPTSSPVVKEHVHHDHELSAMDLLHGGGTGDTSGSDGKSVPCCNVYVGAGIFFAVLLVLCIALLITFIVTAESG